MDKHTDICELFGGSIKVGQYIEGYRFSIDSILLARWCRIPEGSNIADIGAGCGIISIILAAGRDLQGITALEIQDELYDLCLRNVTNNRLNNCIEVRKSDVREPGPDLYENFDVVVSNPPFRELGSGRLNATGQRAIARHELALTLGQLLTTARFLLKGSGTFNLIYPVRRFDELTAKLPEYGLFPSRIREVRPRRDEPANLILIEAAKEDQGSTIIEKPLVIYEGEEYTAEVSKMYEPEE